MHHDSSQAWVDHDQLLARLEQYPESSSIELANDLAAETGLRWGTAAGIVEEYTFRKANDTRAADWEVVRPALLRFLLGFVWLVPTVGMFHLMDRFLPPSMLLVIHQSMFVLSVLSVVVLLLMAARNRRASRRGDVAG